MMSTEFGLNSGSFEWGTPGVPDRNEDGRQD